MLVMIFQKRAFTFYEPIQLPNPCEDKNKICLFSNNEAIVEQAKDLGVDAGGPTDVIIKVSFMC